MPDKTLTAADREVGQRLRKARRKAGLSQRELATDGVSYAYISRIEAGVRTPSVRVLRKLAPRLGVTVAWLETGADEVELRLDQALLQEARDVLNHPLLTERSPRQVLMDIARAAVEQGALASRGAL